MFNLELETLNMEPEAQQRRACTVFPLYLVPCISCLYSFPMLQISPALAPHYLEELMRLAAQLEVQVRVERLGDEENPVESGLAWVDGKAILFIDSRLPDIQKVEVVAKELSVFPLEGMYIKPAIRELLEEKGKR